MDQPVTVLDTGYAIHLQSPGINKGTALEALAKEMGLLPSDFLAIGDSLNDIQMLKKAGIGVTVANAHPDTKAVAEFIARKRVWTRDLLKQLRNILLISWQGSGPRQYSP